MASEDSDPNYNRKLSLVRSVIATESLGDLVVTAISAGFSLEINLHHVSVYKCHPSLVPIQTTDYRARLCSPETRLQTLKQLLIEALWEVYKES